MSELKEEWRQVVGFPLYEVSNTGKIRHIENGEIEGPRVKFRQADQGHYNTTIAREVWRAFVGEIPGVKMVLRKDRARGYELDNLYIPPRKKPATRKSNTQDILRLHGEGLSNAEIARELDISQSAVSHCLKRNT